jgi:UDP-glucose 4-epimerase
MRVLIFGANGFLGNSLSDEFEQEGIEFYTVSRNSQVSSYNVNISDSNQFSVLPLNFFDAIVNCATILPGGNFLDNKYLDDIYKTNILGTQNICKWIDKQETIKKIVNCSTLAVVNKPWPLKLTEEASTYPTGNHVLYSSSKLLQELLFQTFATSKKISISHIRFSALYGEKMHWSGLICNLIDQAKQNKKIILSNASKVTVDFLYVKDAANIILSVLENNFEGVINAANGKETSILDLAKIIKEQFEETIEIYNQEDNDFDENRSFIDISKLKKIIDTDSFLKLEVGIKRLIEQ